MENDANYPDLHQDISNLKTPLPKQRIGNSAILPMMMILFVTLAAAVVFRHLLTQGVFSSAPLRPAFGFTTHISDTKDGFSMYRANIDLLAEEKQGWVRLDINEQLVAPSGTTEGINWEEKGLKTYDAAIEYSRKKNLKVMLATNVPSFGKDFASTS